MIMRNLLLTFVAFLISFSSTFAQQMPRPALVGYWENWGTMKLTDIHENYNVIQLAFATTRGSSLYNMEFNLPYIYNTNTFINDARQLQSEGKVIILSLGGEKDPIRLDNQTAYDGFVASMKQVMDDYDFVFDAIDIDFEGSSMNFGYWTMNNPAVGQENLVQAIRELQVYYRENTGKRMMLTMAPETVYLVGGLSQWQVNNSNGGAMLPVIQEMKDEIDLLHCQFYNAYESIAIDGRTYSDNGSPSYMVAISESILQGFTIKNGKGTFAGFPAEKFAIGLPAGTCSAGSGYVTPANVTLAVDYLRGKTTKPANVSYTLRDTYPDLAGLMTWSINGDFSSTCSGRWTFAEAFKEAFPEDVQTSVTTPEGYGVNSIYPNPTSGQLIFENFHSNEKVTIFSENGIWVGLERINENGEIELYSYESGVYLIEVGGQYYRIIKY